MLKDTVDAAKDFIDASVLLVVRVLCIPTLLAIKLWLPQLPEDEKIRRKIAAREWADADI